MGLKVYGTLTTSIKEYNELSIEVVYQKGGYNYFTDNMVKRGIYITIQPIKRTHGIVACTLLGRSTLECGFSFQIEELGRKNAKKEQSYYQKLNNEQLINEVVRLYEKQQFKDIIQYVKDMIK